jgi:hypothetical protein
MNDATRSPRDRKPRATTFAGEVRHGCWRRREHSGGECGGRVCRPAAPRSPRALSRRLPHPRAAALRPLPRIPHRRTCKLRLPRQNPSTANASSAYPHRGTSGAFSIRRVFDDTSAEGVVRPSRGELARRRRELLLEPVRLVTRREAAQLVGVSLDTVDRRLRPVVGEGRTPSGVIGLPAAALAEHLQNPWPGRGRPVRLDPAIVSRIVMQRNAGLTFAAIAAALNDEGVATAHGGSRWWPATVRKVFVGAATSG